MQTNLQINTSIPRNPPAQNPYAAMLPGASLPQAIGQNTQIPYAGTPTVPTYPKVASDQC